MEIRKSKSPTELWDWFVNREAWDAGTIIMQIIGARFKAAAIAEYSSSLLPSSRGGSWLELEKNNLKLWRWKSVDYLLLLSWNWGHLELDQQPSRVFMESHSYKHSSKWGEEIFLCASLVNFRGATGHSGWGGCQPGRYLSPTNYNLCNFGMFRGQSKHRRDSPLHSPSSKLIPEVDIQLSNWSLLSYIYYTDYKICSVSYWPSWPLDNGTSMNQPVRASTRWTFHCRDQKKAWCS